MKIAVAGASGFVGKNLIKVLQKESHYQIIGLSRSPRKSTDEILWRQCDLFSLLETEEALQDVDVAIYLVHSMLPSAHLSQGHFWDFDLVLADNFARACKKNGVQQILYLGGIVPDVNRLSRHLASRLETEVALSSYDVPLTALRASLVVGKRGSSFRILQNLVNRLPIMICPAWTNTKTQPIDISDVVASFLECIGKSEHYGKSYDIGGPDILTYQQMLEQTAKELKRKTLFIRTRLFSPRLSKLWVSLISGVSSDLVFPLVDSLRHPMLVHKERALLLPDHTYKSFSDSLALALKIFPSEPGPPFPHLSVPKIEFYHDVRSIQRLASPPNLSTQALAHEYNSFLNKMFSFFIHVKLEKEFTHFSLFGKLKLLTLRLSLDRSFEDRILFYVTGGILSRILPGKKPRLEFRKVLKNQFLIVAIHDFSPSLPWFIYKFTQALVHVWVMERFNRHLLRFSEQKELK